MGYFQNINSLAELKKSYRVLALQNHPDKGGSTETMQQINLEFERLYAKWIMTSNMLCKVQDL